MKITTLFLDIGGVILTNGWDRRMRQNASREFNLDHAESDERHHLTFDTYEEGKLSLDEYLDRTVFYTERPFSKKDFRHYMFAQSQPYPDMIKLLCALKSKYNLKITSVSNEGRELNIYRIKKFQLKDFIDIFISSSFVHYRKPDEDIYRIALDISQVCPEEVLYLEDRDMFVQIAESMGIKGIVHKKYESTLAEMSKYDLTPD